MMITSSVSSCLILVCENSLATDFVDRVSHVFVVASLEPETAMAACAEDFVFINYFLWKKMVGVMMHLLCYSFGWCCWLGDPYRRIDMLMGRHRSIGKSSWWRLWVSIARFGMKESGRLWLFPTTRVTILVRAASYVAIVSAVHISAEIKNWSVTWNDSTLDFFLGQWPCYSAYKRRVRLPRCRLWCTFCQLTNSEVLDECVYSLVHQCMVILIWRHQVWETHLSIKKLAWVRWEGATSLKRSAVEVYVMCNRLNR